MSQSLATYSFLPWLRQGLANQIETPDFAAGVKIRAEVSIQLELKAEKLGGGSQTEVVTRKVALFGPGDIVGIDSRAVVRTEPRNWITNYEPNYLPAIEFYNEDLPWRYTPAAPEMARGRLRPWIMLVVFKEDEFTEGRNTNDRPLPYVDVADLNLFPPAEQLWAWAHVHVNRSLAAGDGEFTSKDMGAVIPRFQAVLDQNADLAYSRIVCPRKLAENQAYHAFLVPVFETGRLAGLGLDPAQSPNVTFSAWAAYSSGTRPESRSFPYYYRWFFRTGASGDFESLVRLLKPKPVDHRVGSRDMDVQDPGSNVRGVQSKPKLKGILKLGGALRVPQVNFDDEELAEALMYENWAQPSPQPIQQDLAKLINLADDYASAAAEAANGGAGILDPEDPTENDPDPLITPPLYGTWHALTKRLLKNRDGSKISPDDNWVHELNLDPRFRVAAGFGTRVVQDQQEKYMDAAWEQIGRVLEANRRIRFGQFAKEASFIWYDRHLRSLSAANRQRAMLLLAPLNKRVLAGEFTVHHHLLESFVQPAMTSAALRRIIRPRGRLLRALPFDADITPDNLVERVNAGEVSAAPPKVTPPGIVTVNQVADAMMPKDAPPKVVESIRRRRWLRWLPLIIALVIIVLLLLLLPIRIALAVAVLVVAVAVFLFMWLSRLARQIAAADAIREEGQTPESVDSIPGNSGFAVAGPGSATTSAGGADSAEAVRFKQALKDVYTLIAVSAEAGAVGQKKQLDLTGIVEGVITAINPERTIPRRVYAGIFLPPRIRAEIGEQFVEAMAYPEFDTPMYEPLKKLSSELFLPNINLIEQNSITLLETNQKFIESYMVGLNHEFARELLWREYPTDQRGSYFRQFWDVRSFFNSENLDDAALKEKLRDIPRLDRWPKASKLGGHDNREQPGDNEEEIVLVIRGELLKRYPNAVIYAHRACWQRKDDGTDADKAKHPCFRSGQIDNTKERRLVPLSAEEEANPPRGKVRTPLYEAKVDPDIYFFGFDLTAEAAKGGGGENPNDDPGWFFAIKERPGEPRFGLDIDKQPKLNVWNDLSWENVQPGPPGSYIQVNNSTPTFTLVIPTGENEEKSEQYSDDKNIAWNKDMNSAALAYVLFQAPVLVAVHAAEMLQKA
jgi:hypothetical protein